MPESTITPAPGIRIAPTAGAPPATIATSVAQSAVQDTLLFRDRVDATNLRVQNGDLATQAHLKSGGDAPGLFRSIRSLQ